MDGSTKMGFHYNREVQYVYLSCAGEGMAMMMRSCGGSSSLLHLLLMVFTNKNSGLL